MFSTLPKINFNFLVTFILLFANALNLDWSKILLFGKELTRRFIRKCKSTGVLIMIDFDNAAGKEAIACNKYMLLFSSMVSKANNNRGNTAKHPQKFTWNYI